MSGLETDKVYYHDTMLRGGLLEITHTDTAVFTEGERYQSMIHAAGYTPDIMNIAHVIHDVHVREGIPTAGEQLAREVADKHGVYYMANYVPGPTEVRETLAAGYAYIDHEQQTPDILRITDLEIITDMGTEHNHWVAAALLTTILVDYPEQETVRVDSRVGVPETRSPDFFTDHGFMIEQTWGTDGAYAQGQRDMILHSFSQQYNLQMHA
ncbi:MAG TPA: hypothetical protein VJP80_04365 [Candidatus Saccharimonadales bacterium]|nr:hypothetical protein [Candidatus Saccharimonadales bacterium]